MHVYENKRVRDMSLFGVSWQLLMLISCSAHHEVWGNTFESTEKDLHQLSSLLPRLNKLNKQTDLRGERGFILFSIV